MGGLVLGDLRAIKDPNTTLSNPLLQGGKAGELFQKKHLQARETKELSEQ